MRPSDLIATGDWPAVVEVLVGAIAEDDIDLAETVVCELVARGKLESVRELLEAPASLQYSGGRRPSTTRAEADRAGFPPEPPASLFLRLVIADARSRVNLADPRQLEALLLEVRAPDVPDDWEVWATAILLNQYGFSGNPTDILLAVDLLQHPTMLDMSRQLGRLGRICRAQLLQPTAIAALLSMSPHEEPEEMKLCLDELAATDCWEEHAYTVARFAIARLVTQPERAREVLADYDDAVAVMQRCGSYRWRVTEVVRGWIALRVGDFGIAAEAFRRARRVATGPGLERMGPGLELEILEPLLRVVRGPALPRDVDLVVQRIEALRYTAPFVSGVAHTTAAYLLDLGFTDAARRVIPSPEIELTLPWANSYHLRLTHARLDLMATGDRRALERVLALLHEGEAHGFSARCTAVESLRVSRDCVRVGLHPEAARLRAGALEQLPPRGAMTDLERRYARWALDRSDPRYPEATLPPCEGNALRYLGRQPLILCAGEVVSPGPVAVHLLALLVSERRPVTTDWLLEALWPEEAPEVTKVRLNSLLFRMRRKLGLCGEDDLLVRTVDGIGLEAGGTWFVDAWDFWDLSFGSDADRRRALTSYRGDFCAGLFDDDENIDIARARLRRRFIELACDVIETGIDTSAVVAHLEAIGVSDERIDAALARSA